jgi:hypothetical protein
MLSYPAVLVRHSEESDAIGPSTWILQETARCTR